LEVDGGVEMDAEDTEEAQRAQSFCLVWVGKDMEDTKEARRV
jgi:hypothetical protein